MAVKRCDEDKQNPRLKQEATVEFQYLEKVAYPIIEDIYKNNPKDDDAIRAFEIACRDLMLMRNKWQNI